MAKPNNMDIFKKNQGTESDYRNWKIGKTNISPSSFAKENCNGTDKLAILCTELLDDNIPDNQIQSIIFCRRRFLIVEYIKKIVEDPDFNDPPESLKLPIIPPIDGKKEESQWTCPLYDPNLKHIYPLTTNK